MFSYLHVIDSFHNFIAISSWQACLQKTCEALVKVYLHGIIKGKRRITYIYIYLNRAFSLLWILVITRCSVRLRIRSTFTLKCGVNRRLTSKFTMEGAVSLVFETHLYFVGKKYVSVIESMPGEDRGLLMRSSDVKAYEKKRALLFSSEKMYLLNPGFKHGVETTLTGLFGKTVSAVRKLDIIA